MKKKFAAVLIAVMMAGSVMAGCGEKPAAPTPVTVTKEEPKAEAPASVSRETTEKYILGITDRFVLEGAKDIDFLSRKEILDKVITKVEADDSAVDTTKPGTYKVRYTVTVNVRNLEKAEAYVAEHPEALETAAIPAQEPAAGQAQAEGTAQPAGEAQAEAPAEPTGTEEQAVQPADEAGDKDADASVQPAEADVPEERDAGQKGTGNGDAHAETPEVPVPETPATGPVLPSIPEEVFNDPASSESGDPAETAEVVIEKEVTVVTPEEAVEIIEGGGEVWTDGSTPATVEDITGGEASQAGTTKPAEIVEPVAGTDKETSNEQTDSRQPGEHDDDEQESSGSGNHSSDSEPSHTHHWVEETETVYHEEKGHYKSVKVGTKTVVDEEAWDEDVYESVYVCGACGYESSSDRDVSEHIADVHDFDASYGTVDRKVDTIHHPAVTHEEDIYEDQWVVDSEAWSETVVTGYYCPECGAHN